MEQSVHQTKYNYDEVEAAMCLYDEVVNNASEELQKTWFCAGLTQLRDEIISVSCQRLNTAYELVNNQFNSQISLCFDLELVPRVMLELYEQDLTHLARQSEWNAAVLKVVWMDALADTMQSKFGVDIRRQSSIPWGTIYDTCSDRGTSDIDSAADRLAQMYSLEHPEYISIIKKGWKGLLPISMKVMEFFGTGDPFFGGTADDRVLGVNGEILPRGAEESDKAVFRTIEMAHEAAKTINNRRPNSRLGVLPSF